MAKLSGGKIIEAVENNDIIIDPFDFRNVGPNSYDLTLAPSLKVYNRFHNEHKGSTFPLYVNKENPTSEITIDEDGRVLEPGRLYLGHTNEKAGSTKYIPCIEGRSSLARLGVQVHLTAGFGDLGFIGQWTLEIAVIEPVVIQPNIRICQIYFDTVEFARDEMSPRLYSGKYQMSEGVEASKSWQDYEHVQTKG